MPTRCWEGKSGLSVALSGREMFATQMEGSKRPMEVECDRNSLKVAEKAVN